MTAQAVEKNIGAAAQVAEEYAKQCHDPEWYMAFLIACGEVFAEMAEHHAPEIQAMLNEIAGKHAEKTKRAVMKAYLSSNVEEIAKAGASPWDAYTPVRRTTVTEEFDESKHRRGVRGRFTDMGERIQGRGDLSAAENQAEAARQAVALVNGYSDRVNGSPKQEAIYTVKNGDDSFTRIHSSNGQPPVLRHGQSLFHVQPLGYRSQTPVLGRDTFDLVQALGGSASQAGSAGAVAQGLHDTMERKPWGARMNAFSSALFHGFGGYGGPPHVQTAAALAKVVGNQGPEAVRILQPGMRRTMYKYRGQVADTQQTQKFMAEYEYNSKGDRKLAGVVPMKKEEGEDNRAYEKKLARVLANRIPTDAQIDILLDTGSTPPSAGFIVDTKGKATQLAIGNADDHYVPYNLKQLSGMKGGSYVRSRSYGGPTTEDFATSLAGGAKRFTIASKHGEYVVNLSDNVGRFGPTQRGMIRRYGKLLDAVKHGSIKDPMEGGALTEGSGRTLSLNGRGYEVALQALQTQYPFMIDSIEYTPASKLTGAGWRGNAASESEEDKGYVRPYYLKAAKARAGYHDPKLAALGHGKGYYDDVTGYKYGLALRNNTLATVNGIKPGGSGVRTTAGAPATAQQVQDAEAARKEGNGVGYISRYPWDKGAEDVANAGGGKGQGEVLADSDARNVALGVQNFVETIHKVHSEEWAHQPGNYPDLSRVYDEYFGPDAKADPSEMIKAIQYNLPLKNFESLTGDDEGFRDWLRPQLMEVQSDLEKAGFHGNANNILPTLDMLKRDIKRPEQAPAQSVTPRNITLEELVQVAQKNTKFVRAVPLDGNYDVARGWAANKDPNFDQDKKHFGAAVVAAMEAKKQAAKPVSNAGVQASTHAGRPTDSLTNVEREDAASKFRAAQAAIETGVDTSTVRVTRKPINIVEQAAGELSMDPDYIKWMEGDPDDEKPYLAAVARISRNYGFHKDSEEMGRATIRASDLHWKRKQM